MKICITLLSLLALSACSISVAPKPPSAITPQERALLANPTSEINYAVEKLVPKISANARVAEAIALAKGRPLEKQEMIFAKQVGVKHPERIRIYFTDDFPIEDEDLGGGASVVGLTMNYGIFMKPELERSPYAYWEIITHEFAHVAQYEDLGIDGMSRRLMLEAIVLRDKLNLVEREAIAIGNAVYDDPDTNYGH